MGFKSIVGATCACLAVVSFNVNAAVITYSDETQFLNAVGSTAFENFESMETGIVHQTTIATDNFTVDTTPLNNGTSYIYIGNAGASPTDGVNSLVAGSDTGDGFTLNFDMAFPILAVGFDLTDAGETSGVISFQNNLGDNIEILSSPPYLDSGNTIFWGVNSDTAFTSFSLIKTQLWDGIGIDRMYFVAASPVPIPAAIWLFGSGLIGLAGLARRKADA